ncbi:MAG: homoserine kinase [Elioraea sp.]|nr:homoserine kinase [Elioraea sp.]
MAVYTEVSDEALASFLERYDLGGLVSFKGIAEGVENSNFVLATERGQFILTLYERRVDARDLPYFLGLMQHLAARGVRCPLPVRDRDGRLWGELCGRPAAIVTFLPGVWPRRVRNEHCAAVGAALADLHEAGAGFGLERRNALGPAGWPPLLAASLGRADEVRPGLGEELVDSLESIIAAWPSGLPRGHIHADLFPDNVFFLGERVSGLIDFYFACTDLLAYDLAVCLNAWCFEPDGSFNLTKGAGLIAAYEAKRPLSQAEAEALPVLCAGAAIRFLLTRLHDWLNHPPGALVTPKDPLEYLRKLRFHRGVKGAADYGRGA